MRGATLSIRFLDNGATADVAFEIEATPWGGARKSC